MSSTFEVKEGQKNYSLVIILVDGLVKPYDHNFLYGMTRKLLPTFIFFILICIALLLSRMQIGQQNKIFHL